MARTPRRVAPPTPSDADTPPVGTFPPTSVLGVAGLARSGGFVFEEFHRDLYGQRAARVFREMSDNDSTVGAILFAIQMLIRAAKPTWEAADAPGGEAGRDFVESVIAGMDRSWADVIADALSMMPFGWAWMEMIFNRRDDGRVGLRDVALRAQESLYQWQFDGVDGPVVGMWQQPPGGGAALYIPLVKSLLFRTSGYKNNPEGRSILRNAYVPWYYLSRIQKVEAIGIERDLCGLPVMHAPTEIVTAVGSPVNIELRTMLTRLRRGEQEGVLLPSTRDGNGNLAFELSLLSTAGRRQFDTLPIKQGYQRDIAMTVLADFIFLGQQKVGSFALSSDKTELFATAIGGWTSMIDEEINRKLVGTLWRLNGFPDDTRPIYRTGDLEGLDLEKIGAFLERMVKAGAPVFPDEELQKFLYRQAGLPEPSGEAAEAMMRQAELDAAAVPAGTRPAGDDKADV